MSEIYKSSPLAGGNHITRDCIELHKDHITIVKAGVFKSKSVEALYEDVVIKETNMPLVGFCSIKLGVPTQAFWLDVSGLSKKEVKRIQEVIKKGYLDDCSEDEDDENGEADESKSGTDDLNNEGLIYIGKVYSDELEHVLNNAVKDGFLNEKKKEIVRRRADDEGEDPDEVEMELESRLFVRRHPLEVISQIYTGKGRKCVYSAELDHLITSAVIDGTLTDKKRAIIINRANEEDENIDEVEMELESRLYDVQQKVKLPQANASPIIGSDIQSPRHNESTRENTKSVGTMSQDLEDLIEMALANGELSDKYRNILMKRAASEGLDLDEFEMILDARAYKAKKL